MAFIFLSTRFLKKGFLDQMPYKFIILSGNYQILCENGVVTLLAGSKSERGHIGTSPSWETNNIPSTWKGIALAY